jgi:hypothetical protein
MAPIFTSSAQRELSTQGKGSSWASKGSALGLLSSGMDKAIGFRHEKMD